MKIESTDQDIRNLLSSGYYRIPRFQRPYSWLREHIQEFWDDIVRDNPSDYFIGSMVVFKEGNQRYGLVDGQQRMTTITILLAVLRNALDALDLKDMASGIHALIERRNIDNKEEYVLSTETSYPFFQDHILNRGVPELEIGPMHEEANLKTAYDQLKILVDGVVESIMGDPGLTDDQKKLKVKNRLTEIRDALLNLKVIFVKMDNEDDAYIIFETLNTRGKDLSLTDLVKNHITKHLKTKSASVDQTKIKWSRILETIEGSTFELSTDSFIHHFWLSRYDYLPEKRLFKELKRKIGKTEAKKFLEDLVADAVLYRGIHEVSFGKWTKQERRIADALRALQLFRVVQQTPCVLSLIRAYKGKKIKMKGVQDAIVVIEKFHFLFTAVTSQRSSGGISGMYAALGRRLFEATDNITTLAVITDLKTKLRGKVPSIEEVKALFPEILYTDNLTKHRNLVKYILMGLDQSGSVGVVIDKDAMTIEHLVSQSRIGIGDFTEQVVGQLGNLILVSSKMNEKLRNKPFAEKKRLLVADGFKLPPKVAAATDWTVNDIKTRTQDMATEAFDKVWKI
ncbi:MAG: DUF262 domain-containing HNH endonuclease family protein [Elusimicrobia bacterium]|nr:DUF262 domain-containing HNH endonuclease family protein [Elusimicrobiota bacterium]